MTGLSSITGPNAGRYYQPDGARTGGGPAQLSVDHLDDVLRVALAGGATDVHLAADSKPWVRMHGKMVQIAQFPVLSAQDVRRIVYEVLSDKQITLFEDNKELRVDFAYQMPERDGGRRFRGNAFRKMGEVGVALRALNPNIPTIQELGLPPAFSQFAKEMRGLILVTGPTGSGKSTSLAALVGEINSTREQHIVTIEQPIEYVHQNGKSLISQREVGFDTPSFSDGLRDALREDPDVILLGELRDLETIETAIHAAETGHLVLGTLHTLSAPDAMDRIVDVFEPKKQDSVRTMLSQIVKGVVCQQLVPAKSGEGRVLATEVMLATPAVQAQIKSGKPSGLRDTISTNQPKGMWTMDQNLKLLVSAGRITRDIALEFCYDRETMRQLLA